MSRKLNYLGAGVVTAGMFAGAAHAVVFPHNDAPGAATVNQRAVARALDFPTAPPSAALVGVYARLDAVGTGGTGAALAQFTPGSYSLLPELTLRTTIFEESTILSYLRDFRAGGTGVDGTAGIAKPGSRGLGSFLVASGRTGFYDPRGDRGEVDYKAASVQGGIDKRFGARSLIGVTAGFDQADVRLTPNERTSSIRSWFGGGYGTVGVGPLYVDLFGTYGEATYDLRRNIQFGTTALDYYAGTHSRTFLAGGTTGLSFQYHGVEFEPFAGVRYANLRINGFNEGSSIGALSIGRDKYTSLLSSAGIRAGSTINFDGATIRPEVRGAWRHEFRNDGARAFGYGLNGDTGTTQTLIFSPTELGRDYATVGGGFTISGKASPISLVVGYNGEFGNGRHINGVTGGFRLTF